MQEGDFSRLREQNNAVIAAKVNFRRFCQGGQIDAFQLNAVLFNNGYTVSLRLCRLPEKQRGGGSSSNEQ